MPKWIGKGVLKVSKDHYVGYGGDIPKGALDKTQLDQLKADGMIGEVIEAVAPDDETTSQVQELNRQLTAMQARAEAAEAAIGEVKKDAAAKIKAIEAKIKSAGKKDGGDQK